MTDSHGQNRDHSRGLLNYLPHVRPIRLVQASLFVVFFVLFPV